MTINYELDGEINVSSTGQTVELGLYLDNDEYLGLSVDMVLADDAVHVNEVDDLYTDCNCNKKDASIINVAQIVHEVFEENDIYYECYCNMQATYHNY